jgi:hypothetical protein
MSEQRFVLLRSIVERFEMLARDHQHVHRRLRIEVANTTQRSSWCNQSAGKSPLTILQNKQLSFPTSTISLIRTLEPFQTGAVTGDVIRSIFAPTAVI